MIRLGHTDLVRGKTLLDNADAPKAKKSKKSKADSSDSDWELGWCQQSLSDVDHFKISSATTSKDSSVSFNQSIPPKLPSDDDKSELYEMKSALEKDKGTTSDKKIEPSAVPSPDIKPSKGTFDKLKNLFKF